MSNKDYTWGVSNGELTKVLKGMYDTEAFNSFISDITASPFNVTYKGKILKDKTKPIELMTEKRAADLVAEVEEYLKEKK